MKSSAPTSTVFCLSADAYLQYISVSSFVMRKIADVREHTLFTRMGFPYNRTWFMMRAAYSASSSLMNSTNP